MNTSRYDCGTMFCYRMQLLINLFFGSQNKFDTKNIDTNLNFPENKKKEKVIEKTNVFPTFLLLKLFFRFFLPNNFSDEENVYPTFVLQPFSWKNKCLKKMSYIFFCGGIFFWYDKEAGGTVSSRIDGGWIYSCLGNNKSFWILFGSKTSRLYPGNMLPWRAMHAWQQRP